MKNYIYLEGHKIEISEETAKNFKEQFKDDEFDLRKGDKLYWPLLSGRIDSGVMCEDRNFQSFQSKNRKTLERAEAFIKLQNYADKVNGVFGESRYFVSYDGWLFLVDSYKKFYEASVYFSSEGLAQQAIDHFGEDFMKLYLGVD